MGSIKGIDFLGQTPYIGEIGLNPARRVGCLLAIETERSGQELLENPAPITALRGAKRLLRMPPSQSRLNRPLTFFVLLSFSLWHIR